jgi:Undecaprenyl-phosphate glucose phosphotransferase
MSGAKYQPKASLVKTIDEVQVDRPISLDTSPDRRHLPLSPEIVAGMARVVDFCLVPIASGVAFALYLHATLYSAAVIERYFLTSLLAAALFVAGFQRIGGYALKQLSILHWQLTRVAAVWAIVMAVLLSLAFVGKVSDTYSRGWALLWAMTTLAVILIERAAFWLAITRWIRQGSLARNIVIIGAGAHSERLIAKLRNSPGEGVIIRGVFDDHKAPVPRSVGGCEVLGNTDDFLDFARHSRIDEVIIALPPTAERRIQEIKEIVDKLKPLPTDLRLSVEPMAGRLPIRGISFLGGVPLIDILERPIKDWNAVAKWIVDTALGALLLIALAPAMALIALLIKLDSSGPVFFLQERFGFNNQTIQVFKFRTMYINRGDGSGAQRTVQNDPRVTRVGRALRRLSLDELPQLINVLKGDMSLVGPRPHATAMKAGERLYGEAVAEYRERHRVKPGITGWAQINGSRGEIDTLDKARARVEYDLYYIEHWSLWLDLKILALTVPVLLSRRNAY